MSVSCRCQNFQWHFFEPESYNPAASVLDNVLLGRVSRSMAEGEERVSKAIRSLLDEMDLTDDIFRIGLEFNVGSGGKRLSETQRQKILLARSLLKQPDILIVNQGLNSLGAREQGELISKIVKGTETFLNKDVTVIWVPVNPAFSEFFDRVLVFDSGAIVGDGPPSELKASNSAYQELLG